MSTPLPDAIFTDALGPKCPECGWRRGAHRPAITIGEPVPACPHHQDAVP